MFCKFLMVLLYRICSVNATKMFVWIMELCRAVVFLKCFKKFFLIEQSSLTINPREDIKSITFQIHSTNANFVFIWSLVVAEIFLYLQTPTSRVPSFKSRKIHLCVWPMAKIVWPPCSIDVFFLFLPNIAFFPLSRVR